MLGQVLSWLVELRRIPVVRFAVMIALAVTGPILAIATYYALAPIEGERGPLRLILTADLVYILVVATLVFGRLARVVTARRARSAGSQLHLRLATVFAALALAPTILVAVFAMLSVNQSLEAWFSDRVRDSLGASLNAAEAYKATLHQGTQRDLMAIAFTLNREQKRQPLDDGDLRRVLNEIQPQIQRGIKEMFLVDETGALRVRGEDSYLFHFDPIPPEDLVAAQAGEAVIIQDIPNSEIRGLIKLTAFPDLHLYFSREGDGRLLQLLDDTTESVGLYQQLESERSRVLFDFALLYLAFALMLILAATWVGLWFAERLANPVGELASAAKRVGAGDLDAKITNLTGADEISMLGRYFNQMTKQLKGQRDNLIENADQAERRRRLFDSVLSSVTSGVVGLDVENRITFINPAAKRILDLDQSVLGAPITLAFPEVEELLFQKDASSHSVENDMKILRYGKQENLLVRIASRQNEDGMIEGAVLALEDVTDLVGAQRKAAWGDVARRIAHEIKNPLTPIQLSADRLKRKFAPLVSQDKDKLIEMTDVIARQTEDLRRIVDAFSKFARMPVPQKKPALLNELVRDVINLQIQGQPNVAFQLNLPNGDVPAEVDQTMIRQALTNVIKNAGESIEERIKTLALPTPYIQVSLKTKDDRAEIAIIDNGIGFPEDRAKLLEPYETNREGGTGLGLPIVQKIIEEHGGQLRLEDAPASRANETGACIKFVLPLAPENSEKATEEKVSYG